MTASLKPMRLKLTQTHLKQLARGGRVLVKPAHHMLLDEAGGAVCHVHAATYRRAAKCLAAEQPWHLRMGPDEVAASCAAADEHGGGWNDFVDWVKDAGKAVISVGARYILPGLAAVLSVLPSSDPRIQALKNIVEVAAKIASQLDRAINSADFAEERSAEAHLDVAQSEEAHADASAAASAARRDKELSAARKAQLVKLATEAKSRVAAKKKLAASADKKAREEHAKVAALEKQHAATMKKQETAEKAAKKAAEKATEKAQKAASKK